MNYKNAWQDLEIWIDIGVNLKNPYDLNNELTDVVVLEMRRTVLKQIKRKMDEIKLSIEE
jgi:hypothetical protein